MNPEAIGAIRALNARNVPVIAITNTSRREASWQEFLRSRAGLSFRHVVTSCEVGRCKPHPEIFLEASRRLGLPPARYSTSVTDGSWTWKAHNKPVRGGAVPGDSGHRILPEVSRSRPSRGQSSKRPVYRSIAGTSGGEPTGRAPELELDCGEVAEGRARSMTDSEERAVAVASSGFPPPGRIGAALRPFRNRTTHWPHNTRRPQ